MGIDLCRLQHEKKMMLVFVIDHIERPSDD
jgi:hypothetical protein